MDLNQVALTGNLTKDPELRKTGSGTSVCRMRLAVAERTKQDREWGERPNYFDVTCFGSLAESCATYLQKGKGVAVAGRLRWRDYETAEGRRREAVEVVASQVKFTSPPPSKEGGGETESREAPSASLTPADDDIPF